MKRWTLLLFAVVLTLVWRESLDAALSVGTVREPPLPRSTTGSRSVFRPEQPRFGVSKWDFEKDAEGWIGEGGKARRSIESASSGIASLAVDADFPDPTGAQIFSGFDTRVVHKITYAVMVPEGGPKGVRAVLGFKNKDGLWFQSYGRRLAPNPRLQPGEMVPGRWHRFVVDVSPTSTMLEGRGHFARWGRYLAQQMTVMSIKFFCPATAATKIYIDDVRASTAKPKFQPLRITDLSVNTSEPERFGLYEITFKLNREFDNPFDPEQVRVDAEFTLPDQEKATVPGFFYRDYIRRQRLDGTEEVIPVGKDAWKVRFCPVQAGAHRYSIKIVIPGGGDTPVELLTSTQLSFESKPSKRKGFVRVSKTDPRYFELTTGEFFYPIGHNFRSPNDPRCAKMLGAELPVDRGTFAYDDMLKKMADNGENMFELWMATWWADIEWNAAWPNYQGVGDYNLANAWKLDYLFNKADELDLYIHLVIDNHGKGSWWCDTEWWSSPYREGNGGMLHSPSQLFSSSVAKKFYRRKYRYIIARWGYSTRLMGLELWSEVDLTLDSMQFGASMPNGHPLHVAWHKEMIPAIKELDPWGHPITTHYSANFTRLDRYVVSLDEIEYIVCDAYRGQNFSSRHRASDIMKMQAQYCSKWKKPPFVTEYGGGPYGDSKELLEADLHSGMWGGYMTTCAATPLLWWFQLIDRENLYYHFKGLAAFHRGEDRRGKNYRMSDVAVSGSGVEGAILLAFCLKNENSAYLWVYDRRQMLRWTSERLAREFTGASVTVPNMPQGDYKIEIWSPCAGKILKEYALKNTDGSIKVTLPKFKRDVAVKIKPAK